MKKTFAYIFSFLTLLFFISVPYVASAQLPNLIVCGQSNEQGIVENPCKVCHLYILADRIIDFTLMLIIPLAGLMVAWGGMQYILSRGNPGGISSAQKIIWNGVKGFVISLSAWLIINTLISVLSNGTLTNWGQFPSCP